LKFTGRRFLSDVLIILAVFAVTRLIIFSSIIFIRQGPLSPVCKSYKWVSSGSVVILPYSFESIMLWASSESGGEVEVQVNGGLAGTVVLDSRVRLYVVDMEGKADEGLNRLEFKYKSTGVEPESPDKSWKLWDLRTDRDTLSSALREQNMLYCEGIKTEGISGSRLINLRDSIWDTLRQGLSKWDANMYAGIIDNGYVYNGNNDIRQNIVFPYLFPAAARIVKNALGLDAVWAGALVNNLAFLVSLIFIHALSREMTGDSVLSFVPVILLCIHPFGVFLVSAYSEGLFILFLSISLYLLYRRKYWLYALCSGALSAVRMVGVLAPVVLLYDYFIISKRKVSAREVLKSAAMAAVSLWGIISFMLFCCFKFNDAFAMIKNQHAWTPGNIKAAYVIKNILKPFASPDRFMEPEILGMGLAVITFIFSIVYLAAKRKNMERIGQILATASLAAMFIPLVFYNKSPDIHMAMGRYTLPAFPVFILLCGRAKPEKLVCFSLWGAFSLFMLVTMSMRFAWGYEPY